MSYLSIYIENVSNLDCSILTPLQGPLGQSWQVSLKVTGNVQKNGFICDFMDVKSIAQDIISSLDHTLFIIKDPRIFVEDDPNLNTVSVSLDSCVYPWSYSCPKDAVSFDTTGLLSFNDNLSYTELITKYLNDKLSKINLPSNVVEATFSLYLEQDPSCFCYTHALSYYEGLCQRPYHGHRSKLNILKDGQRLYDLEKLMIKKYNNIHMSSSNQIKSKTKDSVTIDYKGTRGRYLTTLPASRVLSLKDSPTLEHFVVHLAADIKESFGISGFNLVVSEGIGKGVTYTD